MNTLDYIVQKYKLKLKDKQALAIPNTTREDLAILFAELGFKVGAEIGTLKGEYAQVICDKNPGVKLYCVDPYLPYHGYREHRGDNELNDYEQEARDRLAPYNVEFIKKVSVEAAQQFKAGELDFVYIDGNHALKWVIEDIAEWHPRIRPGGIIAGHDYLLHKPSHGLHVVQAVKAYTDSYSIKPYFVLGNQNPKPGEKRDKIRSWFFINK